jgi:tetratricopeptide (TPR) repeat protein
MKKMLLSSFLFLTLALCLVSSGWAAALDDVRVGITAQDRGDYDEAIRLFTKAIASGELSPKQQCYAYSGRGWAWCCKGDCDRSIPDYIKAIESDPQCATAYFGRGISWRIKGNYGRAIADYNRAIELDPKNAAGYGLLAGLLAVCPESRYRDGVKAINLATKAVELRGNAFDINTLAAAYAEAGRFQDAIRTEERAITKLKEEGNTQDITRYEEHLASYKAGRPWRKFD